MSVKKPNYKSLVFHLKSINLVFFLFLTIAVLFPSRSLATTTFCGDGWGFCVLDTNQSYPGYYDALSRTNCTFPVANSCFEPNVNCGVVGKCVDPGVAPNISGYFLKSDPICSRVDSVYKCLTKNPPPPPPPTCSITGAPISVGVIYFNLIVNAGCNSSGNYSLACGAVDPVNFSNSIYFATSVNNNTVVHLNTNFTVTNQQWRDFNNSIDIQCRVNDGSGTLINSLDMGFITNQNQTPSISISPAPHGVSPQPPQPANCLNLDGGKGVCEYTSSTCPSPFSPISQGNQSCRNLASSQNRNPQNALCCGPTTGNQCGNCSGQGTYCSGTTGYCEQNIQCVGGKPLVQVFKCDTTHHAWLPPYNQPGNSTCFTNPCTSPPSPATQNVLYSGCAGFDSNHSTCVYSPKGDSCSTATNGRYTNQAYTAKKGDNNACGNNAPATVPANQPILCCTPRNATPPPQPSSPPKPSYSPNPSSGVSHAPSPSPSVTQPPKPNCGMVIPNYSFSIPPATSGDNCVYSQGNGCFGGTLDPKIDAGCDTSKVWFNPPICHYHQSATTPIKC